MRYRAYHFLTVTLHRSQPSLRTAIARARPGGGLTTAFGFAVTGYGPVTGLGGPLVDHHHVADLAGVADPAHSRATSLLRCWQRRGPPAPDEGRRAMNVRLVTASWALSRAATVVHGQSAPSPESDNDQAICLVIGCGQGRDRTADLPLFRLGERR